MLVVSTFIDDIKIIRPKSTRIIAKIKTKLTAAFEMVDIRLICFYLGLKINKDCQKRIIKLS